MSQDEETRVKTLLDPTRVQEMFLSAETQFGHTQKQQSTSHETHTSERVSELTQGVEDVTLQPELTDKDVTEVLECVTSALQTIS